MSILGSSDDSCLEDTGGGAAVAEVQVLPDNMGMETDPAVVVDMVAGEMMIEVVDMVIGKGGVEAGAQGVEGEVEVLQLQVGGIGVLCGRTVRREEQKLSSGTGKENREKLEIMMLVMMLMTTIEMDL